MSTDPRSGPMHCTICNKLSGGAGVHAGCVQLADDVEDTWSLYGNEDALLVNTLRAVRVGKVDPRAAAEIGLSTQGLDFQRFRP